MRSGHHAHVVVVVIATALLFLPATSTPQQSSKAAAKTAGTPASATSKSAPAVKPAMLQFPQGTVTPSEFCGASHKAIDREFSEGFGSDLQYGEILYTSREGNTTIGMPVKTSIPTLHALAGTDPFPMHAPDCRRGRTVLQCVPLPTAVRDVPTPTGQRSRSKGDE